MAEFRFARMILALAGVALFVAGCGDHRPVWRQAGLPKSPVSLVPPGARAADLAVQVAGPAAAAVTETRAASAEPGPRPKKTHATDPASVSRRRPEPRAPILVAAAGRSAHFVQVGAHRTRAASQKLWNKLESLHPGLLGTNPHFIVRRDFGPPRGTYFQIQLGPFVDRRAADARCAELRAARIDCFVLRTALDRVVLPAAGAASANAPVNVPARTAPPPPARKKAAKFIRSGLGQGDNQD